MDPSLKQFKKNLIIKALIYRQEKSKGNKTKVQIAKILEAARRRA